MSAASTLITNIGELSTQDEGRGPGESVLRDAAVVFEGERISWIGAASDAPAADERVDAGGRAGLPGWVDSHTHLVFAGDRSAEFEARMAGESYAAGGIAVTTEATRAASDYDLTRLLLARMAEAAAGGTTFVETKTGYGLSVEEERRHARIASSVADQVTFLGAHLVPDGADAEEYTTLVCNEMLAAVRPYAQWADVFCERGAFTEDQSRRVLQACRDAGLGLRVHGNQLGHGAGVRLAVEFGAASVDHVNHLTDDDVAALAGSWSGWDPAGGNVAGGSGAGGNVAGGSGAGGNLAGGSGAGGNVAGGSGAGGERPGTGSGSGQPGTVATCLPACDLSTRAPLAPARKLLDAGVQVALASNCNPGTSYTSSMNFCVATAVLQMELSVQEAVRAATFGGALALRRHTGPDRDGERAVGSLAVGHRADLQLLNAPSAAHLAYRPGMPLTGAVWRAGARVGR